MKSKILFIVAITGSTLLGGCKKFLEQQSQSEVIPKTTVDYRELLMGSGYYGRTEPASFLYFMDDDVLFNKNYNNGDVVGSSAAKSLSPTYTWQPSFVDFNGLGDAISLDPGTTAYATYYTWIKGCNAVLDYIDEAIGTQAEKDRVKAEALAVRSLYYWRLVNLYGEPYNFNKDALAVPLKLNSSLEEEYKPRNTVKEVYDVIVNDLKEASRLMDPLPIIRKDFYINQPAIHIFLSRVYLHMENYQGAITEADKVFEQGSQIYNMTGLTALTQINNYLNPEVEWSYGGWTQPEQSMYIPSAELINSFAADDARFKTGYGASTGYFLVSKLAGPSDLNQAMRTSEAVLNRAEANALTDQLTEAMTDLNLLRRNRIPNYADEQITDKEQLIQAIRNERRKEFAYELFRWFDLRRYGMPAITHTYTHEKGEAELTYTLQKNDPMYTLPFPNSLILRNNALKQNPSAAMGDRAGH